VSDTEPTERIPRPGDETQPTRPLPSSSTQPTERLGPAVDPAPASVAASSAPPRPGRRFPWWPVAVAVLGLALVGAVVALVMALNRQPAPVAAPSGSPEPVPAPTAPAAPAEPAPAAPSAPRPEPGPNQCVDALGDGGPFDLDTVTLAADGRSLLMQFLVAGVPADGESGVGLVATREDGRAEVQLGVGFADGRVDRFFVREDDDERELNPSDVRLDGTTITVLFPERELDRLDDDWAWYGFTTSPDGVDACPGAAEPGGTVPWQGGDDDEDGGNGNGNGDRGGRDDD
jgi:hypothetical protein